MQMNKRVAQQGVNQVGFVEQTKLSSFYRQSSVGVSWAPVNGTTEYLPHSCDQSPTIIGEGHSSTGPAHSLCCSLERLPALCSCQHLSPRSCLPALFLCHSDWQPHSKPLSRPLFWTFWAFPTQAPCTKSTSCIQAAQHHSALCQWNVAINMVELPPALFWHQETGSVVSPSLTNPLHSVTAASFPVHSNEHSFFQPAVMDLSS